MLIKILCTLSIVSSSIAHAAATAGPGGNCSITMEVKGVKSIKTVISVDGVKAYLYQADDYTTPIANLTTDSGNAVFKITNLPEGIFDLIISKKGFISTKIPCIRLDSLKPSYSSHTTIASVKMAGILQYVLKKELPQKNKTRLYQNPD